MHVKVSSECLLQHTAFLQPFENPAVKTAYLHLEQDVFCPQSALLIQF